MADDRAAGVILPVGAFFFRDWRRCAGWRVGPALGPGVVVDREASGAAVFGCWRVDDDADAAPRRGACFGGMAWLSSDGPKKKKEKERTSAAERAWMGQSTNNGLRIGKRPSRA